MPAEQMQKYWSTKSVILTQKLIKDSASLSKRAQKRSQNRNTKRERSKNAAEVEDMKIDDGWVDLEDEKDIELPDFFGSLSLRPASRI